MLGSGDDEDESGRAKPWMSLHASRPDHRTPRAPTGEGGGQPGLGGTAENSGSRSQGSRKASERW